MLVFMSSRQKTDLFSWLLQNLCNTEHCGLKPLLSWNIYGHSKSWKILLKSNDYLY